MGSSEKFCLRWNDFETSISGALHEIRTEKEFFDVTLACEDEQIEVSSSSVSPIMSFLTREERRKRIFMISELLIDQNEGDRNHGYKKRS